MSRFLLVILGIIVVAGISVGVVVLLRQTPSEPLTVQPTPQAPAAPAALIGEVTSPSSILLRWKDNAHDEEGFVITHREGETNSFDIATVERDAAAFAVTGLSPGSIHYYKVRAFNAWGNSLFSNEVRVELPLVSPTPTPGPSPSPTSRPTPHPALTPRPSPSPTPTPTPQPTAPDAPSNVRATALSQSEIALTWLDRSSSELSFKIERSRSETSGFQEIIAVPADRTQFTDTGLSADTIYYYRIRASNAAGNSLYSNVANARTQAPPSPPPSPTSTPTPTPSPMPQTIRLENGAVELSFERVSDGYVLDHVTSSDGFSFAMNMSSARQQFSLRTRRGSITGQKTTHRGSDLTGSSAEVVEDTNTRFVQRWRNQTLPGAGATVDVEMEVTLPPGKPYGEFKMSATPAPGSGIIVEAVSFRLLIKDADPGGRNDAIVIHGRGSQLVPDPINTFYRDTFEFPSYSGGVTAEAWPYVRMTDKLGLEGHFLYLANHDPLGWIRKTTIGRDRSARNLIFEVEHTEATSQTASRGGAARFPYAVAVGAGEGGWFDAAELYRDFIVRQTDWFDRGTLLSRYERRTSDYGGLAATIDLITVKTPALTAPNPDQEGETDTSWIDFTKESSWRNDLHRFIFGDAKWNEHLILDWGWERGPDGNIGEEAGRYLPRPKYRELMDWSASKGLKTGGYTLGLGFRGIFEEYRTWRVNEAQYVGENEPVPVPDPPGGWVVMDPGASRTRAIFTDHILPHLKNDLRWSSMHNDAFAGAECWCTLSGHDPNYPGSTSFNRGGRALMRLEEQMGLWNDLETGNPWLGATFTSLQGISTVVPVDMNRPNGPQTDGVTSDVSARAIPFFQSIAHDYLLSTTAGWEVGFLVVPYLEQTLGAIPDPALRSIAFMGASESVNTVHAFAAATGMIPMLRFNQDADIRPWGPNRGMKEVFGFAKKAVAARDRHASWLTFGRMIKPPQTSIEPRAKPMFSNVGNSIGTGAPRVVEPIYVTAFQNSQNEIAVVVANPVALDPVTSQPITSSTFRLTIPDYWGLPTGSTIVLQSLDDGTEYTGRVGQTVTITIPSSSITVFKVSTR